MKKLLILPIIIMAYILWPSYKLPSQTTSNLPVEITPSPNESSLPDQSTTVIPAQITTQLPDEPKTNLPILNNQAVFSQTNESPTITQITNDDGSSSSIIIGDHL